MYAEVESHERLKLNIFQQFMQALKNKYQRPA